MSNLDFEDVLKDFKLLSKILKTGESQTVKNEKLGDIIIDKGFTGKKGYGLLHIIENRMKKGKKRRSHRSHTDGYRPI